MRDKIAEYEAVQAAAEKFVKASRRETANMRASCSSTRPFSSASRRNARTRLHRTVLPQRGQRRRRETIQSARGRHRRGRDACRRTRPGRGLGRKNRLHRLPVAAEDERGMEVRRQGLQPELRHRPQRAPLRRRVRAISCPSRQYLAALRNPEQGHEIPCQTRAISLQTGKSAWPRTCSNFRPKNYLPCQGIVRSE